MIFKNCIKPQLEKSKRKKRIFSPWLAFTKTSSPQDPEEKHPLQSAFLQSLVIIGLILNCHPWNIAFKEISDLWRTIGVAKTDNSKDPVTTCCLGDWIWCAPPANWGSCREQWLFSKSGLRQEWVAEMWNQHYHTFLLPPPGGQHAEQCQRSSDSTCLFFDLRPQCLPILEDHRARWEAIKHGALFPGPGGIGGVASCSADSQPTRVPRQQLLHWLSSGTLETALGTPVFLPVDMPSCMAGFPP